MNTPENLAPRIRMNPNTLEACWKLLAPGLSCSEANSIANPSRCRGRSCCPETGVTRPGAHGDSGIYVRGMTRTRTQISWLLLGLYTPLPTYLYLKKSRSC